MALAAAATTRLKVAAGIAMAFPRGPTVTALSAWTLQKLSRARFRLGLGPQVPAHIERRHGLSWSAPRAWMREYVAAVRAVWNRWQNAAPLNFMGVHYTINLMPPLSGPGPIAHPDIPIHLAAVNRRMCRLGGEIAEGVRPHRICSAEYIANVMIPEICRGAVAAGRSLARFDICHKPLVAAAAGQDELAARIRDVRARPAFYISTPSYRPAVAYHGRDDLAREMSALARAQAWEKMPDRVSDEVLGLFAVVGTHDEIGEKLVRASATRVPAASSGLRCTARRTGSSWRASSRGCMPTARRRAPPSWCGCLKGGRDRCKVAACARAILHGADDKREARGGPARRRSHGAGRIGASARRAVSSPGASDRRRPVGRASADPSARPRPSSRSAPVRCGRSPRRGSGPPSGR